MRKEVLLTITAVVILGIVLFFMMQNTRYESNLLICKHTENSIKITYTQLTEEQTISFEKNGQASKRLSLSQVKENSIHFEYKSSKYKLNLNRLNIIETLNGEISIYACELRKFKM